jgi:hypothetical protein
MFSARRSTRASRPNRRGCTHHHHQTRRGIELLENRYLLAAIASDQTLTGSIGVPSEVDEFTFNATTGDSLVAFVAETSTQAFDPAIQLIAPNAATLISDFGEVGADIFQQPLPQTGTYTLRVTDNGANDTGDYAITIAKLPGAQTANADGGSIPLGGPRLQGAISAGDLDVFTIPAIAGDHIILSIADNGASATFNPEIRAYDTTGAFITNDVGDVGSDLFIDPAVTGTYFVVVKDWTSENIGGNADGDVDTGTYALTMARVPAPNLDDAGEGVALSSGPRLNGTIALGDMDVYTIAGVAGDQVVLTVVDNSDSATFEPQVFVYGPTGTLILSDQGDVGADVNFAAATTGTYYVVVKDFISDNIGGGFDGDVAAGPYTITMARAPGAQTDDGTDGGALSSGPRVRGKLPLGDIDVFTFSANTGDNVILSCVEDDGTAFEPFITVIGPDGSVAGSDLGDLGLDFSFTAATSGTFYVILRDFTTDNIGGNFDGDFQPGEYIMTMAKLPGPQTDDGTDGGPITNGQRVVGSLPTGDIDVYTVSMNIGESLYGVARSLEAAELETFISLYSPTGALLSTSNGTTTCNVALNNATIAGTYYIVIRDLTNDNIGGGFDGDVESGDYALTFTKTQGTQPVDEDSGPLPFFAPRAGSASVGDFDVYTFQVTAPAGFTINMSETSVSNFEPSFRVYAPNGQLLASPAGTSTATFTMPATTISGPYLLIVGDQTGDESGPYSVALNVPTAPDGFAPSALRSEYRFDAQPADLRVEFSEDVGASLTLSDIEITNRNTSQVVPNASLAIAYQATDDILKVTFPSFPNRVLPDGNYRLRIAAGNLTDAAGNPLTGDVVIDFFTLAGDANRDRIVNLGDFNILATNFGKSLRVFSRADFNYDGIVGLGDFNVLASNFGHTLPPPPALAATFSSVRIGAPPDVTAVIDALRDDVLA